MLTTVLFVTATALTCAWHVRRHAKLEQKSLDARQENEKAGLNEPPTIHPLIDENMCIGCGSCVDACPEKGVLGLIDGKAALVEASHCIGHGACRMACPTQAIQLVFGTEKRGVDIPNVRPNFETNVPGIFIAGELGGMGLIGNAVEQGRQAMESIRKLSGIGKGGRLDVVIVGAGPSGFSASLAATQHKLRFTTVEQETLGGTVAHFPRGKIVMTRPMLLPVYGKVRISETTKEKLLALWQKVERDTGLKIRYSERVEAVTRDGDGFSVRTTKETYRTRAVLLTIGRRGTPRKLGVPGEDAEKVVYRLIDPEQYRGKHVLVVGGGDSALEAATSIAAEPNTTVTLSYREKAFTRAKEKNRTKVEAAVAKKRLNVLYGSKVKAVHTKSVEVELSGQVVHVPNDAVIVCAGGILPTQFLKEIGIEVETKHGTA
jgi:thioredoxin reductase/NAD-dependent dihydropyrimidine dehydrogenase PreA subunit